MTLYATVAELREMLPQVPAGATEDALLTTMLERAQAVVDGRLGFSFGAFGDTATERKWSAPASSQYLHLPYHKADSLTAIAVDDGDALVEDTDYEVEADDHAWLWAEDGWAAGRYAATAIWGYGPAPDAVVQVTLELAVNLWRGRDRGMYSDVIGVEGGGAVGYARALTNQQRMALEDVRTRYGVSRFG